MDQNQLVPQSNIMKRIKLLKQVYNTHFKLMKLVQADCYLMETNPEEERHHCWADLTGLSPNTTYFVTPIVELPDNPEVKGHTLKFRTGPSLTSDEPVTYINGGDFVWSTAGISLSKKGAEHEPLFAIIGGDVAYDNGDANCYRRYDNWFKNWMETLVTPSGYSIPILTAI